MQVNLRGTFRLSDAGGEDRTPKGQKERALLAILLLSADRSRSRKWLQSVLWSDRFQDQAAASLRRALSNVRAVLDASGLELQADRQSIWLEGGAELSWGDRPDGALLEDISVKDAAYQKWVRDLRYEKDGEIQRLGEGPALDLQGERILVVVSAPDAKPELRFLTRHFTDTLARHLKSQGTIDVTVIEEGEEVPAKRAPILWRIDVASSIIGQSWRVDVSASHDSAKRFLWAGKMRLAYNLEAILEGYDVVDFVGRAVASIHACDRSAQGVYLNLLAASQKVFLGDRDELELADRILAGLEAEDPEGIARAWRAFVGLTRVLEHGYETEAHHASTLEFAQDAERRGTGNALTTALSSQVALKIARDTDRGSHLAFKAHEYSDANPYALHAMSQASVMRGDFLSGYKYAEGGRKASASLPHSYCWDMQTCLAALGIGKRREAYDLARTAHAKMPNYRPALRYLAALSLLSNDQGQAAVWCERLGKLEPGFTPRSLLSDSYPLDTFRQLGLQDELASIWSA